MNLTATLVAIACTVSAAQPADIEMSFATEEGFELHGTLTLPDGAEGPAPAVLFLSGSGPTDRNGDQGPMQTGVQKQLAEALAAAGIASFRFDKRALPQYAAHFPPMDEMGPFFRMSRFVSDAERAIEAMRARPEIDGARVAVAGHSEGSVIGLLLGQTERPPMAYVCLAGPGRPIAVLMREQIAAQFDAGAPDQKAEGLSAIDRALAAAAVDEPFPADLPPWSLALFNPSTRGLMKDYVEVDPAKAMSKTKGPVLVLNGSADVQVSAERDALALADAARARDSGPVEMVIVEGASHNLKAVASPADPGFAGPLAEGALGPFVAWCRASLEP